MDDKTIQTALETILREAMTLARRTPPSRADFKAAQDYVTDVDLAVDAFLAEELAALTPGTPVLSEERAVEETGELDGYWIVDPIDGTMNLMCRIPFVGISVALVDEYGPRIAAVASVADGVIYSAARGQGAFRDNVKLDLSQAKASELIVLSTGLLDALMAGHADAYAGMRKIGKVRNLGAQALNLCFVAGGGLAAVASIEARVWDEAAGGLIVREAGGVWTAASDRANWRSPSQMMAIRQQRSLAAHPAVVREAADALKPVLG
jgi:myo-inositol-1(or 4)-monophosphatase